VDWVTGNHVKPAVANMSLGTIGAPSPALDEAVTGSIASGVTYVVSAGNDNLDACGKSPARVPPALTVGSSDSTDVRASDSNFGTCVDIFAPGVDITSAWRDGDTSTRTISGTSMAAPHVAGAAALILQLHPSFSPAQVTEAIINGATTGKLSSIGMGSPNRLLFAVPVVRSHVLWQHDNGQLAVWFMVDGVRVGDSYPGLVYSDWEIQGTGDFGGDGQEDILWRHDSGLIAVWQMANGAKIGESYHGGEDPNLYWRIQGTGDFDADGRSDILARAGNDHVTVWPAADIASSIYSGVPEADSQIKGIGDFNGDGFADILWRYADGQVVIWFMVRGVKVDEARPGDPDPQHVWAIQQVGDFNRDGRSDILRRSVNGFLEIWFSGDHNTAAFPAYQNVPGPVSLSWQIQRVGDFNHDGRSDILWRESGGQLAIWFMNGGRFAGEAYPGYPSGPVDNAWRIQGLLHQP
jgi:hypothetical protein